MEILLDDEFEEDIWRTWGPSVLTRWIEERPGTRPSLWWKYQAPEPRRRVGGIGRTQWEAGEDWLPLYVCGIPASRECWSFTDLSDPPQFEAQAVYLKRHGLLAPSEAEALRDRPEAWEPETLNLTTNEKGDVRKC
jgi:hypothetical protein